MICNNSTLRRQTSNLFTHIDRQVFPDQTLCFYDDDRSWVSRKQFVTSFSPTKAMVQRFVTKQSHCLLKPPTPAATMPLQFSGDSPHLEIENNQKIPDGEGTSPFMVFCKLIPRSLFAVLAVALFSSNALTQTRDRVIQPDNSEVSCSVDDPAFVASTAFIESKPVWESKPARPTVPAKPTIDVAPSIGSATEGLPKLQPFFLQRSISV